MKRQHRTILTTLLAFLILALAIPCFAQGVTIKITVIGIRSDSGHLLAALYDSDKGFPEDSDSTFRDAGSSIQSGQAVITFNGIPEGIYAIALLHDENDNEEMDYNFLGIPMEGYGFSNNIIPGFSAPSFDDCSFTVGSDNVNMTVKMLYF